MRNWRFAAVGLAVFLSACGQKTVTLKDFMKDPAEIAKAQRTCDLDLESALTTSQSEQALDQKAQAIEARCDIASKANDILLAGNGVVRVFDPEPMPKATQQDFKDAATMASVATLRGEVKAENSTKNVFDKAMAKQNETVILDSLRSVKSQTINTGQVQDERQWCHQQALYRNTSVDKVSAACNAWAATSYIGAHHLIALL